MSPEPSNDSTFAASPLSAAAINLLDIAMPYQQ
jgi:hypothetical protein